MRRSVLGIFTRNLTSTVVPQPPLWTLVVALGLCLVLLAPALPAQTTSTIEGRITDQQGAAIAGAEIGVASPSLAITRQATSDAEGRYRIAGLPAGVYSLTIRKGGFSTYKLSDIEVTLNRTLALDASLKVAAATIEVVVTGQAPLLEPTTSSTNSTITPRQIETMPLNGRNYLDLMQLVPGVAVQRQNDPGTKAASAFNVPGISGTDAVNPVLGERGGNTLYLIDGMPNSNQFSGGAASEFNQESILEFQVITAGYKAEFGHSSGGIVNVVSKSGTNTWHGGASMFHRNYKLDSSDTAQGKAPFLLRWDPSFQLGGPIVKDKVFFFGSAERIRESRALNFEWPAGTPDFLIAQESRFLLNNQTYETRVRGKLDEQVGHHRFSQQINWTNAQVRDFLPLSAGSSLPSMRSNIDSRTVFLGFNDTATLGGQSNPFLLTIYGQYRGEPSTTQAAHPNGGVVLTMDNFFSGYDTGSLFGDAPPNQELFGYGYTPTVVKQKYTSFGSSVAKHLPHNDVKFGWDFQRTVVDGLEASVLYNQLFATVADQEQFGPWGTPNGPVDSGVYLFQPQVGAEPNGNVIALRNNYNGLYVQDDLRLFHNLTVSGGVRWDYDSRFPNHGNIAPRVGAAWQITPKTVVRGSFGQFYDHFRLGLAKDVPGFGGANIIQNTIIGFPRLFYGNPSVFVSYFALGFGTPNLPCLSSFMTDAAIAASQTVCNVPGLGEDPSRTFYGIDHLNSVVATGHAPIPANAVVNAANVQQLSGLTPAQFASQASAAIGMAPDYFGWDMFGHLAVTSAFISPYSQPVTIAPGFKTPHTNGYQIGVQRELTPDFVIQADYYHRDIKDILGVRTTNLAFEARLLNNRALQPGTGDSPILGYGPWYAGQYDGLIISMRKRLSHRFNLEASYSYANETDNVTSYTGTGTGTPSDSYVGIVPEVTDPLTGQTNATQAFVDGAGNPVPKAGTFYNGINVDKGPSDLALKHTFFVNGLVQLPAKFEFSSIFRIQSGFRYSRSAIALVDVDGDQYFNGIDHGTPFGSLSRNAFTAPQFSNVDIRMARSFALTERVKFHAYFEMFNLFNTANTASVQPLKGDSFGQKLQVLPGREGQVGLRIEF